MGYNALWVWAERVWGASGRRITYTIRRCWCGCWRAVWCWSFCRGAGVVLSGPHELASKSVPGRVLCAQHRRRCGVLGRGVGGRVVGGVWDGISGRRAVLGYSFGGVLGVANIRVVYFLGAGLAACRWCGAVLGCTRSACGGGAVLPGSVCCRANIGRWLCCAARVQVRVVWGYVCGCLVRWRNQLVNSCVLGCVLAWRDSSVCLHWRGYK